MLFRNFKFKTLSCINYMQYMYEACLHNIRSFFVPDRFYKSDTENATECECLHKKLQQISGAEHIEFIFVVDIVYSFWTH